MVSAVLELLSLSMGLFVAFPPLALGPALLFGLCFDRHPGRIMGWGRVWVLGSIALWLGYTVYECAMWIWAKDIVAPTRVDLLAIAPLLLVFTPLGIVTCWRARSAPNGAAR